MKLNSMSRRGWVGLGILLALVVGVGLWMCWRSARPPAELVLAGIFPLTGESAQWGIAPRDGAQLAVDEINDRGGVGGRRLRLVAEDDRCSARDGVSAFTKITTTQHPYAIIGAVCSSVTLAIAPLAEQLRIPLISPASTNPTITNAGDFIFRIIPSDDLRGKVFADYLFAEGKRRVAILYINNEGGVGNRNSFRTQFTARGGEVLLEEAYAQDATDVRSQITRLRESQADAVMVVSYPRDTVLVLRQARELGLQKPLFFQTEAVEDGNVLREAGDTVEGVTYILPAPVSGGVASRFENVYRQRYGREHEIFAAEAFDVVNLLAEIAGEGITSAEGIRDRLYHTRNYEGASGTITFDQNGDVTKPMAIKRIQNGRPVVISTQ